MCQIFVGEYKIGRYIILTIMYSLVYNRLKLRIVVFCHLRMSLFTSAEGEAHLPKSPPSLKEKPTGAREGLFYVLSGNC